ncbi:MAG TPA: IS1595 family transposase [Xanthobacteraceae bacterium]|jgi:transposase-like protein
MQLLSDARFQSEDGAYRYVESHIWPEGPICPHCGRRDRIGRLKGMSTRIGTYKCYRCRKPFTVKINTMLEGSHVLMHVWLKAIFLIGLSRRAVSAKDLVKALEVSPRTAEFIIARVQWAMMRRDLPPHFRSSSSQQMENAPWTGANRQDLLAQTLHQRRQQRGVCDHS